MYVCTLCILILLMYACTRSYVCNIYIYECMTMTLTHATHTYIICTYYTLHEVPHVIIWFVIYYVLHQHIQIFFFF